jgi:glycosyltransferase involved in cell wall biosynthesis
VAVATCPASWYVVAGNNDLYWRVQVPADELGAHVVRIPEKTGKRILTTPNLDSEFRWILEATEDGTAFYPDHEGAAVFSRPDEVRATHAAAMKVSHGARTVAEVDDNYLVSNTKFNPHLHQMWGRSDREQHLRAFASFDAIVCCTPYLRDVYWQALREAGASRRNLEFHVVGNHARLEDWPERNHGDGRLRVGWMGSFSHLNDLASHVFRTMKWAMNQGHEVVFVGHDPDWRKHGLEYTHVPWVSSLDYDRRQGLPFDVGLIPLARNEFNLGKSDVKFIEYTMSGVATVASNIEVYNQTIVHGETGLLAGGQHDFLHFTRLLCEDASLRNELVANAQQYVRDNRLIGQHAHEWADAITG